MSFVVKPLTVKLLSPSHPPIEYILSPFSSDLKSDLFTNLPFTNFTSLSKIIDVQATSGVN